MTNFIQPAWTLTSAKGANQENAYNNLPQTQSSGFDAFGRNEATTFEFKVVYPDARRGKQTGFSNIRPTTVTKSQNRGTGDHLYNAVAPQDPRTDNVKSKPFALDNMRVQTSSFNNPDGSLIAILGFLAVVVFMSVRR